MSQQPLSKTFVVSFSGKTFSETDHPAKLEIIAPTKERAKEWADLQLKQWIKCSKACADVEVKIEEVSNG